MRKSKKSTKLIQKKREIKLETLNFTKIFFGSFLSKDEQSMLFCNKILVFKFFTLRKKSLFRKFHILKKDWVGLFYI